MKPLLVASLLLLSAASQAQRLDARAILAAVHARDEGDQARLEVRMTIRDARGSARVRDLSWIALRDEGVLHTLVRLRSPSDVAGTTLLTRDYDDGRADEQWLHLPAFRRTTRVVSSGRARSFLGSDLSYADLSRRPPEDFDARLLAETTVDGQPCWHLEVRPRTEAIRDELGYARAELWIARRTHLVLRSRAELADGRTKYVQAEGIAEVDGVHVARRVVARTLRGQTLESETILERRSLRFSDPTVTRDLFDPAQLGE